MAAFRISQGHVPSDIASVNVRQDGALRRRWCTGHPWEHLTIWTSKRFEGRTDAVYTEIDNAKRSIDGSFTLGVKFFDSGAGSTSETCVLKSTDRGSRKRKQSQKRHAKVRVVHDSEK
jgi:maltoporin